MRWLSEPINNFMIRLGYLKAIVATAGPRATSLERFVEKLQDQLCKDVSSIVPGLAWKDAFEAYRVAKTHEGPKRQSRLIGHIELQDAYISDPRMPSNLGAVASVNFQEVVNWASWLGLIKPRSFSMITQGITLKLLLTDDDLASFSQFTPDRNPFLIGSEGAYLTWLLIQKDGGLLKHLFPRLVQSHGTATFSRVDAVRDLRDAFVDLRDELRKSRARVTFEETTGLKRTVESLDNDLEMLRQASEGKKQSSDRRALFGIMRASPRLENFVDLGFLDNASGNPPFQPRLAYEYRVTDKTKALAAFLVSGAEDIDLILSSHLFDFLHRIRGGSSQRDSEPNSILPYFATAYRRFHRELGAKPIVPLCIGAACLAFSSGRIHFEISEAYSALLALRGSSGGEIRLSGGHTGDKPEFVVLDQGLVDRVADGRG